MAKSDKKKKKSWYSPLIRRYRLILLNERTYEEQFAFSMSLLRLVIYVISLCLVVALFVVFLFMFTPIKQLVPGYMEDKWREDANYSRSQVDSLIQVMREKDAFIENLKVILDGGTVQDSLGTPPQEILNQEEENIPEFSVSEVDSALRARIAEEDAYSLGVTGDEGSPSRLYFFTPISGTVSSAYDARNNHYGIDLVAPSNSLIKSVLEGTVVLASWTSDGGYVIQIQHPHNYISVYKHNSVLLKRQGDKVEPGDAVAIIGDSGENTDGPHLHFELWKNGVPVNPADYINFQE